MRPLPIHAAASGALVEIGECLARAWKEPIGNGCGRHAGDRCIAPHAPDKWRDAAREGESIEDFGKLPFGIGMTHPVTVADRRALEQREVAGEHDPLFASACFRQFPIVVNAADSAGLAGRSQNSMTNGCRVGLNAKRSSTGRPQSGRP